VTSSARALAAPVLFILEDALGTSRFQRFKLGIEVLVSRRNPHISGNDGSNVSKTSQNH
jgi:hypothetical protein